MRTIRFRLIKNKKIVGYENHQAGPNGLIRIFHSKTCKEKGQPLPSSSIEHDIKDEFIGFHDKSKSLAQVFENDIVRYRDRRVDDVIYFGIVSWIGETRNLYVFGIRRYRFITHWGGVSDDPKMKDIHRFEDIELASIEVIGNVWKNPEILPKAEEKKEEEHGK